MTANRFVILDRDGTILVLHPYLSDPQQVALLPGVATGMRKMRDLGFRFIVISNQSGIERGFFDYKRLDCIHQRMRELLKKEDIVLDGIYYCPHLPGDHCTCRKPQTGLLEQAAREHGFNPKQCVIIGDNITDIQLGERAGAMTILLRTGYGDSIAAKGEIDPDYIADGMEMAAEIVNHRLKKEWQPEYDH